MTTLPPHTLKDVASVELIAITTQPLIKEQNTLTLKLKDKYGNGVAKRSDADIILIDDTGKPVTLSVKWTDDQTSSYDRDLFGIYTTKIAFQTAGKYQLKVTVNGKQSATKRITVIGQNRIESLTVIQDSALSDGKSTNTIKVHVVDSQGKAVKDALVKVESAKDVTIGSINPTDSQGDTKIKLRSTTVGYRDVTVTLHAQSKVTSVNFIADKLENVIITPFSTTQAGANSTLFVKLSDKYGHPLSKLNGDVIVNIDNKSSDIRLEPFKSFPGTFMGTIKGKKSGRYRINIAINGIKSNSEILVVSVPETISSNQVDQSNGRGVVSSIELKSSSASSLHFDDKLHLTVTLKDIFDNTLKDIQPSDIKLLHKQGAKSLGHWKDNQNGSYSAELTLAKSGQDELTITMNGEKSTTKQITVAPN